MKEKFNTIEESLHYISCRLDEVTGNGMSNSYLKLDMEPVDVGGIEDQLQTLNEKVDKLTDVVDSVALELQSLSSINETLEAMLHFYIEFNKTKKSK